MANLLNISSRKVGGIRFIQIGRFNFSYSVSTPATFAAKRAKEARRAVVRDMVAVERLCSVVIAG